MFALSKSVMALFFHAGVSVCAGGSGGRSCCCHLAVSPGNPVLGSPPPPDEHMWALLQRGRFLWETFQLFAGCYLKCLVKALHLLHD